MTISETPLSVGPAYRLGMENDAGAICHGQEGYSCRKIIIRYSY